ncbi:MAG: hypothetical protein ABIT37_13740 [Luteolibacter sp.]
MRTATIRDLRNNYTSLQNWLDAGEEIAITKRGKRIARLIPDHEEVPKKVNWAESPAVTRDRTRERILTAQESSNLIHDASGKW